MLRWFLINFITLLVLTRFLPGFTIDSWKNAALAVLAIGIINVTIKPLAHLLSLPITILTLGLFAIVINTLMLLLASSIVPGFQIDGFVTALIASICMSLLSSLLDKALEKK